MRYQAFLSYAHHDDQHEGPISKLRSKLEQYVGDHLGDTASIFQDKNGLAIGVLWEEALQSALRCPCLVPIITPAYMNSETCLDEFLSFAKLEEEKQLTARILPLYYIEVAALEARLGRSSRQVPSCSEKQLRVLDILIRRQMEDMRWLRLSAQGLDSDEGREMLDKVAKEVAVRSGATSTSATIEVSPTQPGLSSISTAIKRAEAGTRILVKGPYSYRESLFIDKPLQIIGEPGVILVGVGGPAIACTGSPVRIANMQIYSDNFNAVIISGGYCVLEEVEVSKSRHSAVLVRDGAQATLIRCSLHHAEHCGMHAQHGSSCTIVCSTISENGTGGLFFSQDAGGVVDGNLIERNRYHGIYIAAGANPLIRRNCIKHHDNAGILVYRHYDFQGCDPGRGIIEDNEISENNCFGIEIKENAAPFVRGNKIRNNSGGGIWTHEGGCGTICDNTIIDNAGAGIKNDGGRPTVGSNTFSRNTGPDVDSTDGVTW